MTTTIPVNTGRQLADRLAAVSPGLTVDTSTLTLSQYAFDASNYRVTPLAVAFPRSVDDVRDIVRCAAELGISVTTRGSGTSIAGNAVGAGVILETARHLNRIYGVDPEARTVTVDAGVLLDDLHAAASGFNLMFGPDPSSHSRITIGGMIGNDACGNHSVAYGRTSDHVVAISAVLADGTPVTATRGALTAVYAADAERVAALERGLRDLAARNLTVLRTELDRTPRQVSGYHLHRLLPEHRFDAAKALAGSEGTLAVITSATLALVPMPARIHMLVVGYDDLVEAAGDVPEILRFSPSAIEAMDEAIVDAMRRRTGVAVPALPAGRAWLYIELADDAANQSAQGTVVRGTDDLIDALRRRGNAQDFLVVAEPAVRSALWSIRENGAGLASNLPGAPRSWPGWEDAAVAPDLLAEYLRRFRALLAEHHYRGVLYGHFGAGCVHVRINFDTSTESGLATMRTFLGAAAGLVAGLGGSVSGEHGDGRARSELLPAMYSNAALTAFADAKALFDPQNLLNPGIIVDPVLLTAHMLPTRQAPATALSIFALSHDGGSLSHAAGRCIGVGRCVAPTGGVMCPSYRATGLEKDSTRGRARALQDFTTGTAPATAQDVLETLDLCLSCKACATDCPTGVDMATYKAVFLHQHYRGRIRPRSHYTLGWLPALVPLAAPFARTLNVLARTRTVRATLPRMAGVTSERSMPTFATRRAQRRSLAEIPPGGSDALLFVDTFTRAFRPEIVAAAGRVLADAGIAVSLAPSGCCGLTWITTGQLGIARRVLRRSVSRLSTLEHVEKPVIMLEPSCAAAFAGDAAELVGTPEAHRLAERVLPFSAALQALAAPDWTYPTVPRQGVLQTHCHERSVFPSASSGTLLRAAGMSELDEAIGCCGLAGNFGFEPDHYPTSMAIARTALAPALERAGADAVVVADGFSCATQIEHLRPGRPALHLAQLLDQAITRSRPS